MRCQTQRMRFATREDYRAAWRDHRSWWATLALFLSGTFAFLAVVAFLLITGTSLHPDWLIWTLGAIGGALIVWSDAAHRIAGRRIRA